MEPPSIQLTCDDYTVGWVAVLPCEVNAARLLLEHEHENLDAATGDPNNYILGDMGGHNVVLAYPGAGRKGESAATSVATNMLRTFEQIRFGLLAGIAGAAPKDPDHEDALKDIRLGDVVVSCPVDGHGGGVRQVDYGKRLGLEEFKLTDHLNKPPTILLTGIDRLRSDHTFKKSKIYKYICTAAERSRELGMKGYVFPGWQEDQLFKTSYHHRQIAGREEPESTCSKCDPGETETRVNRDSDYPAVHYGLIASGNQVVRSAEYRDQLREKYHILCFEMEAAGLMDNFPCLVIRGICDYSDDRKNKAWQSYTAVTAAAYARDLLRVVRPQRVTQEKYVLELIATQVRDIHSITSNTNARVHNVLDDLNRDKDAKVLNWLSKLPSQKKQRDVLSQHEEGTGRFLLESQKFKNWLRGQYRILWCIGPPGMGKTVLASVVVDTINKRFPLPEVGIAFLYCVYAERNDQTLDQLLGSIIQQLLLWKGSVPKEVLELYDSHNRSNTRPGLEELSKHLGSIISHFSKVYIVVDALDECDDINGTRTSLLKQLQNLDTRVQLLFTSRPLEIHLDATRFELTAQEDDMRKYLSAQIKQNSLLVKFCIENKGLEDEIVEGVISKADGMFLLAKLHLQSIADRLRVGLVRQTLDILPNELDATYNDALERMQKGQGERRGELAMKILMLVSHALRPLKLGEIQHALWIMEVKVYETSLDTIDVYAEELLLTICAGIVILEDSTSTVRFVHHTAETYFESKREVLFKDAQIELTKVCVTYLSFKEFESGHCRRDSEFEERLWSYQLYDYAANNWGYHAREASTLCQDVMSFLKSDAKVEASSQALMVSKWDGYSGYSQDFPRQTKGLHLAAYFGAEEAVEALLREKFEIDVKDTYGRTPLLYAVRRGNATIVELLLEKGARIEGQDRHGQTPLQTAVQRVNEQIINLLLDKGANIEVQTGNEKIINLLLDKGANIEYQDGLGWTPLSFARERE
ncbi:hypothetical protein F5884DRAFT_846723 [Xylogone sp. PMI_703]|nr:hypothetical protein F5884DRAFT_846723 [Xylogone sp. PMI_703]